MNNAKRITAATVEECHSLSRSIQPIMERSFCDAPMVGASFAQADYEYLEAELTCPPGMFPFPELGFGTQQERNRCGEAVRGGGGDDVGIDDPGRGAGSHPPGVTRSGG